MKKFVIIAAMLFACVSASTADSYTYVSDSLLTNGQISTSAALPISGYLDRIEMYGGQAAMTSAVVVASYTAGGTTIDTFANVTALAETTPKVIRPRFVGTTTAGVNIAPVELVGGTNVSTVLTAPYDRPIVGGNVKVKVTGTVANTNTVTVILYYEPIKH